MVFDVRSTESGLERMSNMSRILGPTPELLNSSSSCHVLPERPDYRCAGARGRQPTHTFSGQRTWTAHDHRHRWAARPALRIRVSFMFHLRRAWDVYKFGSQTGDHWVCITYNNKG